MVHVNDWDFRIIVSANQLSFYGAVTEIREEFCLFPKEGLLVMLGQSSWSLVLSVIKTEVPLDCDDPGIKDLLLQQYGERIGKRSQQDKFGKFFMDAGFLNVVEIWQYFRTKDTADLSQFFTVASREKTLRRDEEARNQEDGSKGTQRLELEVAISYLYGKYGVEIRNLIFEQRQ